MLIILICTACSISFISYFYGNSDENFQKEDNKEILKEEIHTNLEAFARLYGYVRYFHPSDESAELNWEQFAVYGAGKVKGARNTIELKAVLEEIFLPIAPTMILSLDNKNHKSKEIISNGSEVIAWQHF
jgi:hypothetical protein